jgi:hypothetical protein
MIKFGATKEFSDWTNISIDSVEFDSTQQTLGSFYSYCGTAQREYFLSTVAHEVNLSES